MQSHNPEAIFPGEANDERTVEESRRELLSRDDIVKDYRISKRWLELAALSGDGPPMVRISRRMVRYQRGAFEDWLNARVVTSTSERIASGEGGHDV